MYTLNEINALLTLDTKFHFYSETWLSLVGGNQVLTTELKT